MAIRRGLAVLALGGVLLGAACASEESDTAPAPPAPAAKSDYQICIEALARDERNAGRTPPSALERRTFCGAPGGPVK